ncbi:MAG: hypothetical protein AB9873_17720 [Syntrophobacteraceae bacterium]
MAYSRGAYPAELANKVGHIKLIQDPMVQRMIESFEDYRPTSLGVLPNATARIDLNAATPIEQVITVDGGHQAVPNVVRPERQVGFVQIVAQMIKLETIEFLRTHPMVDPRDLQKILGQFTHHTLAAIPIAGVRVPGLSVRDSIRESIHRFVSHYELYPALSYLVYRQWETNPSDRPSMDCLKCNSRFELPRKAQAFDCPHCRHSHWLSDYLGLCESGSDDRSTEETVSNFRAVMEVLVLFSTIVRFRDHEKIMGKTLFLLDGPLLLRAQLSRLVEPIRDFVGHRVSNGMSLFLIGVEKGGEFRSFADSYESRLENPGEVFVPSTRYVVEEINGRFFDETTYRNRVNYGAKAIVRVGPDHVLAINVPTGAFLLSPSLSELIGIHQILPALAKLVSYSYQNALIPVVLANQAASISDQPSGGILAQFVDRLVRAHE